ncbi:MAG: rubredoxin [Rikenellaceae bacterium]
MKSYKCDVCGHIYDPALGDEASGVAAGTPFEELPEGWHCPICNEPASSFTEL